MSGTPDWVALAWRLPAGLSTPRVTTWRNLQRLGAARLTPGAAVLPFREDLQEQLDWLAQDIESQGGEAWVLPVTGLSESEEHVVRERMAGLVHFRVDGIAPAELTVLWIESTAAERSGSLPVPREGFRSKRDKAGGAPRCAGARGRGQGRRRGLRRARPGRGR